MLFCSIFCSPIAIVDVFSTLSVLCILRDDDRHRDRHHRAFRRLCVERPLPRKIGMGLRRKRGSKRSERESECCKAAHHVSNRKCELLLGVRVSEHL